MGTDKAWALGHAASTAIVFLMEKLGQLNSAMEATFLIWPVFPCRNTSTSQRVHNCKPRPLERRALLAAVLVLPSSWILDPGSWILDLLVPGAWWVPSTAAWAVCWDWDASCGQLYLLHENWFLEVVLVFYGIQFAWSSFGHACSLAMDRELFLDLHTLLTSSSSSRSPTRGNCVPSYFSCGGE